jgi:hypothetical protein
MRHPIQTLKLLIARNKGGLCTLTKSEAKRLVKDYEELWDIVCIHDGKNMSNEVKRLGMDKRFPKPKVGDTIYVDTRMYIDHGEDDMQGGRATISKVNVGKYGTFVEVKELPNDSFNYYLLMEDQAKLKKEFGRRKAYPDPDYG